MTILVSILLLTTACEVVYDESGECQYWYYLDSSNKHNPCGEDELFVPEQCNIGDIDYGTKKKEN